MLPCADTIDQIRDLTKVGLNPKHIHAAILQNNPQSIISQQDVYNQRLYHRGEYLNGRTPLEALLDELNEGWVTQYMQVDGRLRSLFFASQEQVELMRYYPDIVLMDSTYKSNRYNMPLLHFGGVTPNNTYYSATFAFMSGESEEDFYWAIDQFKRLIRFDLQRPKCFITDNDKGMRNALSQVFDVPQMLCSWHIQQNVLHRVKLTWRLADYVEGSEERTKAKEQQDLCMKAWVKACL